MKTYKELNESRGDPSIDPQAIKLSILAHSTELESQIRLLKSIQKKLTKIDDAMNKGKETPGNQLNSMFELSDWIKNQLRSTLNIGSRLKSFEKAL